MDMSNEKPNFKQIVEQSLLSMKKRTSQLKGEFTDNLTESIAENFKQFYQIADQLVGQIDLRDKQIEELTKKLAEYESVHPELKIASEKPKKK